MMTGCRPSTSRSLLMPTTRSVTVPVMSAVMAASSSVSGQFGCRWGCERRQADVTQERSADRALVTRIERRLHRPEGQQSADQRAFVLRAKPLIGARLPERGEHDRRVGAV